MRVGCLACVCPCIVYEFMVHLMWVAFVSVATQTNPLDLWDDMVLRNMRDHRKLVEEDMVLFGLEFINSDFFGLEWCYSSTRSDYPDRLSEVYEMITSLTLWCTDNSPCATGVESEKGEETLPSMTVTQLPPMPSVPILATGGDHSADGTPVVKVPNKNPSCPCCRNQIGERLGQIEHLKKAHRRKKILFQCSCCGRTTVKCCSIASHFAKCKGLWNLRRWSTGTVGNVTVYMNLRMWNGL